MADTRSSPNKVAVAAQQDFGEDARLIEAGAETEAELRVVLEERVRPGRAAAAGIRGVGRGGQVAAVDRRATGGVGDEQAVAEKLGEQLEIRAFRRNRRRHRRTRRAAS
jgi:hypothetical protein